jgi:tryptophanyl-tRNA synthetase
VPVGEDQVAHLEITREIARRFNSFYGDVFPEPQPLLTPTPKVPGIDGRKMSKSYGNAIGLTEDPDTIRRKCMEMFTDPQRVRRSDPGRPEVCNLFRFHELLTPEAEREDIAIRCRAAEIGCVDDKKILAETMIEYLAPFRRRREELLRDRDTLLDVLRAGSEKARERAIATMERVRAVVGLDYDALPVEAVTEPT